MISTLTNTKKSFNNPNNYLIHMKLKIIKTEIIELFSLTFSECFWSSFNDINRFHHTKVLLPTSLFVKENSISSSTDVDSTEYETK